MKISTVSLFKRSFYDKTLTRDYVRRGEGGGFPALLAIALITAFAVGLRLSAMMRGIPADELNRYADNMPEFVIAGGRIVSDQPIYYAYDDGGNSYAFVINTQDEIVSGKAGIYVLTDRIVVADETGAQQQFSLQSVFGGAALKVTPDTARNFIKKGLPLFQTVVPAWTALICVPFYLICFYALTYFLAFASYAISWSTGETFTFGERARLGLISLLPALCFGAALNFLGYRFSGGLTTQTLIALFYLLFFMWQPANERTADDF